MDQERSFDERTNLRRDFEKAQLQEKKAVDEVSWLKSQVADQKQKLRAANEENDSLQEKLLELKGNYMQNNQSDGLDADDPNGGLQDFERNRMQQAIDELSERCRKLRDENKKLDAENNFFHMSTTIFIKLKPIMETEKQLCH